MLEYLSNFLPRLRQFSETLDKKEILVDQPWVLIDENVNKHTYIFERGGRLLVSLNGDVEMGRWEYIPAAQSLLIHVGEDRTLLNQDFVSKGLLALKKDGLFSNAWILANEKIIPDLNVEKYLKTLLQTHLNLRWIKTESGLDLEYTAIPYGDMLTVIGASVSVNGDRVKDGTYKIAGNNSYLVVEQSIVRSIIKHLKYITNEGELTVDSYGIELSVGNKVHIAGVPVPDGRYEVKENSAINYFDTSNGIITAVKKRGVALPYILFSLLGIVIALVLVLVISVSIDRDKNTSSLTMPDQSSTANLTPADTTVTMPADATNVFTPVSDQEVKDRVESFLLASNSGDNQQLSQYLPDRMTKYYNLFDVSASDVINEIIRYRTQVVESPNTIVQKDSMNVSTTSGGYVVKTKLVDMSILRRNNIPYYYITQNEFRMDKDLKITYADGDVVEKGIDYFSILNLTKDDDADKFYEQINEGFFNRVFLKLNSSDIADAYKDAIKTSLQKLFDNTVSIQRSDGVINNFYGFCDLLSMGLVAFDHVTYVRKSLGRVNSIELTVR